MAELDFLGHHVSSAGVAPLPSKVAEISVFPIPVTERQLRKFIGMITFYHCFLRRAADHLQPLYQLLTLKSTSRQDKKLDWTEEALQAFHRSKNCGVWQELPDHVPEAVLSGRVWRGAGPLLACLRSHRYPPAFNMGETLHRTLPLPVLLTTELPELAGEQLQALQTRLEGLRLLTIDEMSMVGRKLFRAVALRLRQTFPYHTTKPFRANSV